MKAKTKKRKLNERERKLNEVIILFGNLKIAKSILKGHRGIFK